MRTDEIKYLIMEGKPFNITIPAEKIVEIKGILLERNMVFHVFGAEKIQYNPFPSAKLKHYLEVPFRHWKHLRRKRFYKISDDFEKRIKVIGTNYSGIIEKKDFMPHYNVYNDTLLVEHIAIAPSLIELNHWETSNAEPEKRKKPIKAYFSRFFRKGKGGGNAT